MVDRVLAEERPLVLHDAMEAGHLGDAAAAPLLAGAERTRRGAIVLLPDCGRRRLRGRCSGRCWA